MSRSGYSVDVAGILLPADVTGGFEVRFDERQVWAFAPEEHRLGDDGRRFVPWHREVARRLRGQAVVSLHLGGRSVHEQTVRFSDDEGGVDFTDASGHPIMVDKWGLIQRPFSGRGEGVVAELLDVTEQVLEVLSRDCGVQAWVAFGSLLGAVREGGAIGHDSDIDLAYLSDQVSPAAMTLEMYEISRALRRAGFTVLNKSGAFITVVFGGSDGAQSSLDLYVCFHLGDLLYETATVREPVPRSAVLPLSTVEFEGRRLPAPADPERLLEASYGPDWRVPNPTFTYRPDHELKARFDPWFGNLMRQRRAWEGTYRREKGWKPSPFARAVQRSLSPDVAVVDVGCGRGADALFFARRGHRVVGLDYARPGLRLGARRARVRGLPARFEPVNLYDLRDSLTAAALLRRSDGPYAVYARGLLDALTPEGRENFWRLARGLLATGGTAYLEFGGTRPDELPTRFPVSAGEVVAEAARMGGRAVAVEQLTDGTDDHPGVCRMRVEWGSDAGPASESRDGWRDA